ncbi:hypothetical protein UFOVP908_149 [uncultured Caudovirales phage]|uniref:Uncharacterized protein n=1 Tax=uncultured Caudovirales phage TaxID=2100421 RepID=A0A6J5R1A4_9CAUD|nr:hypothetical protein UFOVP908_149 [uncultured Caudovirales phage]CAB4177169.1 hypothetical protein UFOVP990_220 [uncultured Caudovirales phage]CAB4181270.1 hypothetical protein UFOVP1065_18 [uncultured Caudovirales phage]CAB4190880.1 hypothetical protein UFOVP1198_220 [uncultured Caudovirales phage]CAB4211231.1 hypothetical protein UFOVP1418_212 [uncultured Caudovirales phage]
MAAYVELYMDQGASFTNTLTITDDVTNAPVDVTGYTITSQMRRSYYSANATANITCTIVSANTGNVQMSMTPANTALIKPGRYLFDVETTDNNDYVVRILEGIINVTPGITR